MRQGAPSRREPSRCAQYEVAYTKLRDTRPSLLSTFLVFSHWIDTGLPRAHYAAPSRNTRQHQIAPPLRGIAAAPYTAHVLRGGRTSDPARERPCASGPSTFLMPAGQLRPAQGAHQSIPEFGDDDPRGTVVRRLLALGSCEVVQKKGHRFCEA
jgi:hypothetical protein